MLNVGLIASQVSETIDRIKLLAISGCFVIIIFGYPEGVPSVFAESIESRQAMGVNDLVDFWAASRLLITGGNPFSPTEVLKLQQSVGYSDPKPLLMWNPPWTLSFILPIGLLDYELSQFIWMFLNVFAIVFAAQKLWVFYGQPLRSYSPLLIAFTFGPTVMVLIIGQITPVILLGLVGFLYLEKKGHLFLAGLSTTLMSIKPHLVYLLWPSLLLWVCHRHRWRVACGAIVAGSVVIVIPVIINSAVYWQFIEMYRFPERSTPFELPAPSIGTLLKLYVPHGNLPVQFLPPLLGVLWFIWHWQQSKESWNWCEQVPILTLVSVTFSPYAWTYDYVLLLPAIMDGFIRVRSMGFSWSTFGLKLLYITTTAGYLIAKLFVTTDAYFFWLAPVCLLTYLGARALSWSANRKVLIDS